jgi:histidyl-tRNA synthetase
MAAAWESASRLRANGLSVEMFASGSPRKRFDRAVKKGAREIIVLGVAEGKVSRRIKSNDRPRAEALLAGLSS